MEKPLFILYSLNSRRWRQVKSQVYLFLFQHLLKIQDEYKKREAELEKVREDKLKIETLLENLKEQVGAIPVLLSL